ncbi:MAG TPA: hypothetical protein VFJ96_02565 [Gemmatimonadaceae bacterium]|nr:hypothetical protein [Gemmatimonadaceae bacterium]
MPLSIINRDPAYPPASLMTPTQLGYILIAAEVHPRRFPLQQLLPEPRDRAELFAALRESMRPLEQLDGVERVTLFDATVIPPARARIGANPTDGDGRARFDVAVLIETDTVERAREIQDTPEYATLVQTIDGRAKRMQTIVARNAKRIDDVDTTRPGVFLFNYFSAPDQQVMLQLWDYLAGWYEAETGLDNSILLVPAEGEPSPYAAINNARWDTSLAHFIWDQFATKSFWTYVRRNLEANDVTAFPILYRLAPEESGGAIPSRAIGIGAMAAGAALAWWGWHRFNESRPRAA